MLIDQSDEMLRRSARHPLAFTVALHPFIIGQPFRMASLRRTLDHVHKQRGQLWITVPGEVAKFCASLPPDIVPGS